MRRATRLLILLAPLALGACGLQPLYQGGARGVAASTLASVEVAPIPERAGYLVRSALQSRLGEAGETPRYRLHVELDDQIVGFGIRGDSSITRERRILRARYRLVAADKGTVLLEATAGSDAGIDVVRSDFAVVAAENTALERLAGELADQITARIATFARQTQTGADGKAGGATAAK